MQRSRVFVFGLDPITQAGVASQLRPRPEILIVESSPDEAEVAVVVVERLDEEASRSCRAIRRDGCPRVVLVVAHIEEQDLLTAVEIGVSGVLRRSEATAERLVESISVAQRGEASLPNDLLKQLMRQMKHVQDHVLTPANLSFSGLSDRETEVLRLISEGQDTRQIADLLCYSERTIKNIVQDVTRRFGLRNRSHAVAYALRQGLI